MKFKINVQRFNIVTGRGLNLIQTTTDTVDFREYLQLLRKSIFTEMRFSLKPTRYEVSLPKTNDIDLANLFRFFQYFYGIDQPIYRESDEPYGGCVVVCKDCNTFKDIMVKAHTGMTMHYFAKDGHRYVMIIGKIYSSQDSDTWSLCEPIRKTIVNTDA